MTDFGWSRPLVLLVLILLPLYGLARRRVLRRGAVPYAPLQYRRVGGWRRGAGRLLIPVELLLLALVILGLAGPYTTTDLSLMEDEGIDVVLVLDVSLSMLAEDFPPNRLAALQQIARDFIGRSGSTRVALVIFAKDTFVQSPLTTDHVALFSLLDGVTVHSIDQAKSGGTAVGDALLVATDLLGRSRIEGRDQALILISDGESNSGAETSLAARYVRQVGIRLYAIGIGGVEPIEVTGQDIETFTTILDDAQLRAIAELSGGRYFRATDVGVLESIFAELSRLESAPLEVRQVEIRRYLVQVVALLGLPLFAVTLALGGIVLRRPFR